jgi:CheY-like chemotaxis protein
MYDGMGTLEQMTRQPEANGCQPVQLKWQRSRPRVTENVPNRVSFFALTPRRVLVIEDHRDGRDTLRALLELVGHQVEVATDGVQGLGKALANPPEVAIVDIGLPGLNGYEIAKTLRSVLGRDILLIAHTGYGQPEDRRQALEAGFDVHLTKPVDFKDLAFLIESRAGRGLKDRAESDQPPSNGGAWTSAGSS